MIPIGLITKGIGALAGGIQGAASGGGLKGFAQGALGSLSGSNTSGGGTDPAVAEGIAEVNEKVDTLIAAHDDEGSTSPQETTQLSTPVPSIDWSQGSTSQNPVTNGTGGGKPTFSEPAASNMSAVADPNQPTPPLPFYGTT